MKHDEFRVFISSTFMDLMPEREQLIKKVFPQIRALCRERGVEFTEIDLRWGITTEEARTGKTVRICLEEIDRCRPYFIGIIGSRYGWAPGMSVLENDPTLVKSYPWLDEYCRENKSITDMEFSHGAILQANTASPFIYQQVIVRDEVNAAPIEELCSRIASAGIPCHQFSTPQELGEYVLRDLTSILDRDWPAKKEMTPAERERTSHEAFARNRTHSYIANPEYTERFEQFVESDETPLILWGKSGFGKSALMAHLTSEYRRKHPGAFVVRHFVGATTGASSMDDVMRHIMLEIKERYSLTDDIPSENLQAEFSIWLAKISEDDKLIIAVDAVNQLTGIGDQMRWLPDFIPSNVHLIISTTPEISLEELRKRKWQELEILPLSPHQRIRISEEFLARYHKRLPQELSEMIGSEAKLESPLFLRTLLEELRIFGVHEALDQHLASYLASETEAQLFQTVLARMERDHGEETVRSVMSAIFASRFGLSETELLQITGLTRLALSEFLIALEFHLMRRTGLFTFFHNYLREAVEVRYAPNESAKKKLHRHLAFYFSGLPASKRRSEEEPTQWIEAGERKKLLEMFGDSRLFLLLAIPERHYELLGYWTKANANDELPRIYSSMYHNAKADHSLAEQASLFTMLGGFLTAATQLELAEEVLVEAVVISNTLYGEEHRETANSLRELATVFLHRSKNTEAADAYKKAITVFERIGDLKEISETQSNLAVVYYNLGKYELAMKIQTVSVEMATQVYGRYHPILAEQLNNLASYLFFIGAQDEAKRTWEEAIAIDKKTRGEAHPQTIRHEINLATLLVSQKQYEYSLTIFQNLLELLLRSLGNRHSIIAHLYRERSQVLMYLGAFKKAEDDCNKAIEINTLLFGEDNILVSKSYLRLARIYKEAGKFIESEIQYRIYIPKAIEKIGISHPEVVSATRQYFEVLEKLDRREEIDKFLLQFPSLHI